MLQRIQTVYLFLVFIFGFLYLIFPVATLIIEGEPYSLKAHQLIAPSAIRENLNAWFLRSILLIALFAHMILTIIITFKYKKRMLQVRLSKFNMLLLLILIVVSFFYIDSVKNQLLAEEIEYGVSIFFPFVSIILILIANRAIRKDEDLVRAADRIR